MGVDTGLAHLAVALKVPTVAICTDTEPSLTGIYPGLNYAAINLGSVHRINGVWTLLIRAFVLVESVKTDQGVHYQILQRWPLAPVAA